MSLRSPYDLRGDRTDLMLHVRPMKDTGVLFYTDSQSSSDFLGLALKNGYVVYRLVSSEDSYTLSPIIPCYTVPHHTIYHTIHILT